MRFLIYLYFPGKHFLESPPLLQSSPMPFLFRRSFLFPFSFPRCRAARRRRPGPLCTVQKQKSAGPAPKARSRALSQKRSALTGRTILFSVFSPSLPPGQSGAQTLSSARSPSSSLLAASTGRTTPSKNSSTCLGARPMKSSGFSSSVTSASLS